VEVLEVQASHTDVGAYLVGLWGLPVTIAEAIAYHEDPSQAPSQKFGLPGIVHAADRIVQRPDITDPASPELGLNVAYFETHGRLDKWNHWREACVASLPTEKQQGTAA
jgi:HD-like signal output (HDOD) protein